MPGLVVRSDEAGRASAEVRLRVLVHRQGILLLVFAALWRRLALPPLIAAAALDVDPRVIVEALRDPAASALPTGEG